MSDDPSLLRRFASDRSELAFAELVERHVNLVYSAALRQVGGDAHRARDVSQQVFIELARHAPALLGHPVLTGWLYTTAHHIACKVMRAERRRRAREKETQSMDEIWHDAEPSADWSRLRPVLEEVMQDLGERDRTAVLLRFFEGRAFAEIGAVLSLTENAARMRVERALDKMRLRLGRRGVISTTSALGALLASQAVVAAPAGLGAAVAAAAVASAAAVGGGGALAITYFMGLTKLQTVVAGALIVAAGAGVFVQQQATVALREEVVRLERRSPDLVALQKEHQQLEALDISAAELEKLRADSAMAGRLRNEISDARRRPAILSNAGSVRSTSQAFATRAPTAQDLAIVGNQLPKVLKTVTPTVPLGIRFEGSSGTVFVTLKIDGAGDVVDATADDTSDPELAVAALDAIYQWKFTPAMKDGRPQAAVLKIPVVFSVSATTDDRKP